MIEFISQPWHWSVSGVMISLVMLSLIYLGQRFGVSSSFKAICTIGGAGIQFEYFDNDWRKHDWLLIFVVGSIIGGVIASTFLVNSEPIQISTATINDLSALGISYPKTSEEGSYFLPTDIFNLEVLKSLKGIILIVLGGFLIGFGTRWGGGCTSGHALMGLSSLQFPSLVAVIGFFIGGLVMTHLLFPFIFSL
jgi:uncharacterized membrane protein YedE/YeeE